MKKTKSPILEAVHETARGLYEVGAIDKVTMREYDWHRSRSNKSARTPMSVRPFLPLS
jgi:DNA-binding transcriptional regulator YiaG